MFRGRKRRRYISLTNQKQLKPPRIDESRYAGRWLELHPETFVVVADGETLRAAMDEAAQLGVSDPVMHPVPESDGYFVGAGRGPAR